MRIDVRIRGEAAYRAVVARNRESLGSAPVAPDIEVESGSKLARQFSMPPCRQAVSAVWRPTLEDKIIVVVPTIPFSVHCAKADDCLFHGINAISSLNDSARPRPYVADRRRGHKRRLGQQKRGADVRSDSAPPRLLEKKKVIDGNTEIGTSVSVRQSARQPGCSIRLRLHLHKVRALILAVMGEKKMGAGKRAIVRRVHHSTPNRPEIGPLEVSGRDDADGPSGALGAPAGALIRTERNACDDRKRGLHFS